MRSYHHHHLADISHSVAEKNSLLLPYIALKLSYLVDAFGAVICQCMELGQIPQCDMV